MTHGVAVRNQTGGLLFNSAFGSSMYYRARGIYSANGGYTLAHADLNDWNAMYPIGVPVERTQCFPLGSSGWASQFYKTAGGVYTRSNAEGWDYTIAQKIVLGSTYSASTEIYQGSVDVQDFGIRAYYNPAYGMKTVSPDGFISIHEDLENLRVQTDVSGNFLFTATASTLNTTFVSGGARCHPYEYDYSVMNPGAPAYINYPAMNVVFPKPLVKPPLIFITNTQASLVGDYNYGVSLYKMVKNGAGLFIGAIVCCPAAPTIVTPPTGGAISFYKYSTDRIPISFSYYIVSNEDPLYMDPEPYGIVVKSASGAIMFSSKYVHPRMEVNHMLIPNRVYSASVTYDYSPYPPWIINRSVGGSTPVERAGGAICINNFRAFSRVENTIASGVSLGSPVKAVQNYVGQYLSIVTSPANRVEFRHDVTWGEESIQGSVGNRFPWNNYLHFDLQLNEFSWQGLTNFGLPMLMGFIDT